jgi:hypothetical protein
MTDFVEYKRPLIVLLIFASLVFLASNFGGHIFSYENFVDQPYSCAASAADRAACVKVGGYWKADGGAPSGCDPTCNCCIPNASFPLSVTYPSACSESNEAFTLTEALTLYSASESLLPTASSARGPTNQLTEESLKAHMANLTAKGVIKTPPAMGSKPEAIHEYLQADEATLNAMQAEYCYYATRYRYCIIKLIETSTGVPTAGASASQPALGDWLAAARTLNTRLMDLVSIMKALTVARMEMGPQMGADVAKLNADLSVRMKKLSEQSGDLASSGNGDNKVYKKMVEYTKQKAKANANLVLLYTFMNLVALGMLFYVYRAS